MKCLLDQSFHLEVKFFLRVLTPSTRVIIRFDMDSLYKKLGMDEWKKEPRKRSKKQKTKSRRQEKKSKEQSKGKRRRKK